MTATLLAGIHDREGTAIAPKHSWVLDTVALSENPPRITYHPSFNWITRLNWGYGSTGTIPTHDRYAEFAQRVADYVAGSSGCSRWIIGNEPNLPREWPDGQPIHPAQYAECYLDCRYAIRRLPGHERDEVLIAAPGPWNNELAYPGNPNGDWIHYFQDVLDIVEDDYDGAALHAYTHGYDPALVTSAAKMDAPFAHRHYEFRTYRDYLAVMRRGKKAYITEANGNGAWRAVGLMPAMLGEIDAWNASGGHPVECVIFYRYPPYDENAEFAIEGKADVIAEFQAAAPRFFAPQVASAGAQTKDTFMPSISTGTQPAQLPPREIDPRAEKRGITIQTPRVEPGQQFWRVRRLYAPNEAESDALGPDRHILTNVLVRGERQVGVPLLVTWGNWGPNERATIHTKNNPGFAFSGDHALTPGEFTLEVADGKQSERVVGIRMGDFDTEGRWNPGAHTSTLVDWELVTMPAASQPAPNPEPQQPAKVPMLAHPVQDPRYRIVTQSYGVNGDYYKRFSVDGVPLQGHNGIDFGTPVGTIIAAVDAGRVVEVTEEPGGYGRYIKLLHSWGESLYAHLDEQHAQLGETVGRGEYIGTSGYSGNVLPPGPAGAHLHFGLRVHPFNRRDGMGGFTDPAPYLINTQPTTAPQQTPANARIKRLIQEAAKDFSLDWRFVASLAWYESSWMPTAISPAGAMGIMQLMPHTWEEWRAKTGASNPYDERDNIRTGTAYLAWLMTQLKRHEWTAVVAYNFGIGNVLNGVEPPPETVEHANRVVRTLEFLEALGL